MIDFTRYAGPKLGGAANKLLDHKHSDYLGIKMATPFTMFLVLLVMGAAFVAFYRIVFGLGASTNMNDYWPWGSGYHSTCWVELPWLPAASSLPPWSIS